MDVSIKKRMTAEIIERLREHMGVPNEQQLIAARLGVHPSSLSRSLNTGVPPRKKILEYCERTGADYHWIINGSAPAHQKPCAIEGGDKQLASPLDPHLQEYQHQLTLELQRPPQDRDPVLIKWLCTRIDDRERQHPPIKGGSPKKKAV